MSRVRIPFPAPGLRSAIRKELLAAFFAARPQAGSFSSYLDISVNAEIKMQENAEQILQGSSEEGVDNRLLLAHEFLALF